MKQLYLVLAVFYAHLNCTLNHLNRVHAIYEQQVVIKSLLSYDICIRSRTFTNLLHFSRINSLYS